MDTLYQNEQCRRNLINLLRMTCPCGPDQFWCYLGDQEGYHYFPKKMSISDLKRFTQNELGDVDIEVHRGNGIDPPEIYYLFESGATFVLYPEQGYVAVYKNKLLMVCAEDWVRIFGCPEY